MGQSRTRFGKIHRAVFVAAALGGVFLAAQGFAAEGETWGSRMYHFVLPESIRELLFPYRVKLQREMFSAWRNLFSQWFAQPYLYLFAGMTFMLEKWIPATKQRVVSAGLLQDFLWFIATAFLNLTVLAAWYGALALFYDRHLAFLNLESVGAWPLWLRAILSVLTFDLCLWVGHFIRHRSRVFWCFHLVHHSQREINFFSDDRFHLVDGLMASAVRIVPMKMVGLDFESIVALAVIMSWYTRVYHGNIRSNYGVLKYILVTPQSHRIHHSIEERHWGKNLGTYFTIWDRLFGTLYPHYDEYPATGIPDGRFPCEKSLNPLHLAGNFVRQFFYPFGLVLRRREASVAGAYSWVRR